MQAILKQPRQALEEIDIPYNDDLLETLQGIIGGYIEAIDLYGDVQCICDEDGNAKNLQGNCGLVGPLVFLAVVPFAD